ncbi:MAG: hypothetical protein F6K63_34310 [Moorea sp. SIO1G6]|uniref:hypothetical protein n=1 Tax=unclassified Moorena TaxID=2683338 RepID=UPI0013BDC407|nr:MULTISPECIES: hypothetical protein [unclassified Moorena]NEQ07201.1 hypothetical protein [Moorena sp. SIO4E2]NEQ12544.1 hypothetical protein [Moorena sp. SIO3E2]NES81200.1 hypothetical protein [Moorena sp. SIO2B7]NET69204.1 hypothetical protein [Moorena sp. SIO1G6]
MNKDALSEALIALANQDRPLSEKIFLKLLRQVWQIDWTVAAYDVWGHYIEYDVPYFLRFMKADVGDEAEEKQLLIDWIGSRLELRNQKGSGQDRLIDLIEEVNQLRASTRKGAGW